MASRSVSRASIAHNSARLNPLVRCNLKRLAAEGACRRRLVATLRRAARQHHLLGIDTVVAADTRAHETRPATVLGDDGLDADRDAQGAMIVPKSAMSGEDKMALRAWRAQRQKRSSGSTTGGG